MLAIRRDSCASRGKKNDFGFYSIVGTNRNVMKFNLCLIFLLAFSACKKEFQYDSEIKVEDYYSAAPIVGQMVVLYFCEGVGLVSGRPPCDSILSKFTDQQGRVRFTGTNTSAWDRQEIVVWNGQGYPKTRNLWLEQNGLTTIRVKPFSTTDFRISSTIEIDSLSFWIETREYGILDFISKDFQDSLAIQIPNIPDEENTLGISGYRNDTLISHWNLNYTPTYGGNNVLEFEFK